MTELSFIDFKCPHCGDMASFLEEFAGTAQSCPTCSDTVIVPKDGAAVGRAVPLPLTTPRLVLRRFTPTDWKDLLEVMSDEEMFHHVDGLPLEEEQILRWLDSDTHVKLTTPNQPFHLGLEERTGRKLIGYAALRILEQASQQANVSVFVNRKFQRQGFATEALKAMLLFCFDAIGLHRVTAHCESRDAAACRLLEKAGMQREGEFRQDRLRDGEWVNTVWFGALSEDLSKAKP